MVEENQAVKSFINEIYSWLQNEIFVITNLISLIALIILGLLTYLLRKRVYRKGEDLLISLPVELPAGWLKFWEKIHLQLTLALLVWLYNAGATLAGVQATALTLIAGYLLVAWLIIQFITWFLPENIWVKFISLVIWVVAVLNILGIYQTVIDFLEEIELNLGEFQFSLILLVQGLIFFIIIFWIAGWLETFYRKRLQLSKNLTPSVRILLQKVGRITLFTVAFLIGLSSIGIDLTAFAFIGGAVGVGLGFGLQKIVSNFISGIIIILDKSIKPGDIVETDDVFGRVSSLNTRFVSVVTLSGKEYLIPNEDFITSQVINWSYSDDLVRLDSAVGVGYDSDLKLVRKLIIKAMEDKERILKKPERVCLLKNFGDNTVDFEFRFWIQDPEAGVDNIRSEVLLDIWDLLQKNDVNIAFPQRDLHLKSITPEAVENLQHIFARQQKDDK